MKAIQTCLIAGLVFFLSAGVSFGAEMDDLDLTIRVVESDDVNEMHNELSLPDMASDTAREHAEGEEGHGVNQANDARDHGREGEAEHEQENDLEHELDDEMEARDEREDAVEDDDELREDNNDRNDERGEANGEEEHEEEHERKDGQ